MGDVFGNSLVVAAAVVAVSVLSRVDVTSYAVFSHLLACGYDAVGMGGLQAQQHISLSTSFYTAHIFLVQIILLNFRILSITNILA